MKSTILSILALLFSFEVFSQHDYSNPRTRKKRSLLEDEVQEKTEKEVVKEEAQPVKKDSKFSKGETKFCACEKNYFLSLKRYKHYNKQVERGLIKSESDRYWHFNKHKNKSLEAMKLIRGKYEIDADFDCEHSGLSFKKLSLYSKEIKQLINQCDIEIITE